MKFMTRTIISAIMLIAFLAIGGCSNSNLSSTVTDTENSMILGYLDFKVMTANFGGKVFSAYKLLGRDSDKLYIWANILEYYKKNGLVEQGSGWSVPLVLNLTKSDDVVSIAGHKSPGDGSLYSKDIKIIFPKELQKTILFFPSNSTQVKEVGERLKKRVDEWSK